MLSPSTRFFSFRIVYKSSKACVGCSSAPDPALIIGIWANSAASRAAPSSGCLSAMMSA